MTSKVSNPGELDFNIRDTSEKALQRCLLLQTINGNSPRFGSSIINWIDLELPVILSNNGRRPSIDLVGRDENGTLVLCEVKFNNTIDSPHDAECEILNYVAEILLHYKELDENEIHHSNMNHMEFRWEEIIEKKPRVMIIADRGYWQRWQRKINKAKTAKQKSKRALAGKMIVRDSSIECYSIDIEKDYFKKQFNIKKEPKEARYKPDLDVYSWSPFLLSSLL